MTISFKKYSGFVSSSEDFTDEQINEIFGLFANNSKIEKLKAEKEKLKKDTAKKVADWRAKKELASASEKDDDEQDDTDKTPSKVRPSGASAGRAAERDWLSNMATEAYQGKDVDDVINAFRKEYKNLMKVDSVYHADDARKIQQMLDSQIDDLKSGNIEGFKRSVNSCVKEADVYCSVLDDIFASLKVEDIDELYKMVQSVSESTISEDTEEDDKEYFGIGEWGNPYRVGDSEYFLVGPFEDRKSALASVKRRLDKGQPSRFTDWVSGKSKIVDSVEKVQKELTKLKLVVPKTIKDGEYEIGNPVMWRLKEL